MLSLYNECLVISIHLIFHLFDFTLFLDGINLAKDFNYDYYDKNEGGGFDDGVFKVLARVYCKNLVFRNCDQINFFFLKYH